MTDKPNSLEQNLAATTEQHHQNFFEAAYTIGGDMAKGAVKELVDQPLHLVESAAMGTIIGVGVNMIKSKFLIPAAGLYATYELGTNWSKWTHAADVISNPSAYDNDEQRKAHREFQGIGASGLNLALGSVSGLGSKLALESVGRFGGRALENMGSFSTGEASMGGLPTPRVPRIEPGALSRSIADSTAKATEVSGISKFDQLPKLTTVAKSPSYLTDMTAVGLTQIWARSQAENTIKTD